MLGYVVYSMGSSVAGPVPDESAVAALTLTVALVWTGF